MCLRHVGTNDKDNLGIFQFPYGIRHRPAAKCCGQTGHGRSVSGPGTMINIIGTDHRAGKFLDGVVVFIADAARAKGTEHVGTVPRHNFLDLRSGKIKGLVPAHLCKHTVFTNHGMLKAIRA